MGYESPRRVWILLGVAAMIGAGILVLFWSLGVQGSSSSAEGRDRGVFAFVSPDSKGAMFGWVSIDESLAPQDKGSVTVDFSVAATSLEEVSVVIGGPIASSAVRCFADGGTVLEDVAWGDLNIAQQDALVQHELTRPVTGRVSRLEQNYTTDPDIARETTEQSSYLVIHPGLLKDWETTVGVDGVDRTYQMRYGTFSCSFPVQAFWEDSGAERILSVPDVVGARGTIGADFGGETYLYAHRTFNVDASSQDLMYSSIEPTFDETSSARFLEHWSNYDYTTPSMVSLAQVTAVMSPRTSELQRQLTFLGIGFLVATEIALLPVIARSVMPRARRA